MVRRSGGTLWILLLASVLLLAGFAVGCRGGGNENAYPDQEEVSENPDELSSGREEGGGQSVWKWDGDTRALRNPFERPGWIRQRTEPHSPSRVAEREQPKSVTLHLQGILYGQSDSKALINGRWVRVGDRIEGHRVVKIDRTSVLLRRPNGSLIALSLGNRR